MRQPPKPLFSLIRKHLTEYMHTTFTGWKIQIGASKTICIVERKLNIGGRDEIGKYRLMLVPGLLCVF